MQMKRTFGAFAFLLFSVFTSCSTTYFSGSKRDISPMNFGLAKAGNGVERYNVLYETHKAAVAAGVNVDYSGIKTINLEIPENAKRIPLTQFNDFKGCVLVVKNTTKNHRLFNYAAKETPISINKQSIDNGDFRSIEPLRRGRYLLLIEDENPWVLNRKGYKYGHQRKDVLLVENGRARNATTMPYNNAYSKPKCTYVTLDDKPFVFKNITIERDPGCTFLTDVAYISGAGDVQISNVKIHTPTSNLTGDRGIMIYNCANVALEDVTIDGTYSQTDRFGYGFTLNNLWNLKVTNMYGKGNWGVFGDNNINTALIEDSEINRFDIHCYGRDISFKNVEFFDLYNQYSSVFGTISHNHCTFTNFVPVLNGGSYNSFVAHDIVFDDCVFNATEKKNYLIKLSKLETDVNARKELAEKALPNVKINNLTVNMTEGADYLYLFYTNSSAKKVERLNYLSNITIDGMTVVEDGKKPFRGVSFNNVQLNTAMPVACMVQNVEVRQARVAVKSTNVSSTKAVVIKANMPLKGGKMVMKNVQGLKQ